MYSKSLWEKYTDQDIKDMMDFCEGYKNYISIGKTERACVSEAVKICEAHGYKDLNKIIAAGSKLNPGDKIYITNKNKNIALFIIGTDPIENGINILGAHIDSPRIDLKQNPLYERTDFALLDTHYYGGIKKYQWVTIPLAMHGVICKKDGTSIDVVIGEDPADPVIGISDLLIHLSRDQMQKPAAKAIEGEDLDITVGSMPLKDAEKDKVKANVMKILADKYDICEEDFLSAEIEIVPAGPARDYGLDRSMIAGYGHDDRVCAYTSMKAILDIDNPKSTVCAILVDKEEIGSVGATGAHSLFFENTVAEIINATTSYSDIKLRRTLANSRMLSSDVSAGYDPLYPGVNDPKNAAYFGKGICFNKYTGSGGKSGSNDAMPEYVAKIRKIMDDNNINYQTAELGKVDQGGGGTIAYILGNYNMYVIDAGIPVFNMHAPMEIVSKADVYETYLAYKVFLLNA